MLILFSFKNKKESWVLMTTQNALQSSLLGIVVAIHPVTHTLGASMGSPFFYVGQFGVQYLAQEPQPPRNISIDFYFVVLKMLKTS